MQKVFTLEVGNKESEDALNKLLTEDWQITAKTQISTNTNYIAVFLVELEKDEIIDFSHQ